MSSLLVGVVKKNKQTSHSEQHRKKKIPGEIELEQWIEQAEYEINVDTYRGIQRLSSACDDWDSQEEEEEDMDNDYEEEGSIHSSLFVPLPSSSSSTTASRQQQQQQKHPRHQGSWRQQCSCRSYHECNLDQGNPPIEKDPDDGPKTSLTRAEMAVRTATHTSCPSLIAWTEKANRAKKKNNHSTSSNKSKQQQTSSSTSSSLYHLGKRPSHSPNDSKDDNHNDSYRCPCDYNPFCWVSLGGAITEILQQQYYQQQQQQQQQDEMDHHQQNDPDKDKDSDTKYIIEVGGDDDDEDRQSHSSTDMRNNHANDHTYDNDMDWNNLDSTHYDPFTALRLKNVRTYCDISKSSVRQYLQNILGITNIIPMHECLQRIQQIHSQKYFTNPLLLSNSNNKDNQKNPNESKETIRIALPPGIENLGATCYLNTQLQCLARNRVLVEGIAEKWKATREDRISDVLKLFQKILVSIEHGPVNVLNTREFSNALGLDHFEQQDPNEFSRLLLDKFHESFQESSDVVADLLPTIFQGVVRYEMTCLTCQSVSKRTEKFMDLNLPIVPPPENGNQRQKKKSKGGQQSIAESFGKNNQRDTDVQICLDQYCEAETFEGDNQYHCTNCGCKRDAQREMKFEKLPPVLNIQLSRYVFDRQNCVKKKLSDKVLLPRKLYVRSDRQQEESESKREHHDTTTSDAAQTNTYILCAVMRHKGTSAYSGHYIAEAMDWLTGQWFEFNDEQVHVLEHGPSSSCDPSPSEEKQQTPPNGNVDTTKVNQKKKGSIKSNNGDDKQGSKKKKNPSISGSTDAYNMYYVEECFLAQSTLDEIRKLPVTFAATTPASETAHYVNTTETEATISVVEEMVSDRAQIYSELTELCLKDKAAADRLEHRREIIRKKLLPDLMNPQSMRNPDDLVWVDAVTLRRFVSCRDRLSDLLNRTDRWILDNNSLLCYHNPERLHPRIARKGKLLPRVSYEAYVEALQTEQAAMIGGNLSKKYKQNLELKLMKMKELKYLYEKLDPKLSNVSLEISPEETIGRECDSYAYVVSRKFITWFRNKFSRLLKTAVAALADSRERPADGKRQITSFLEMAGASENMAEGLDFFKLSQLDFSHFLDDDKDSEFLLSVNGSVTCIHGNFDPASANSYKFVNWTVWRVIKNMFPTAIEHKQKRRGTLYDDGEAESNDVGCIECRQSEFTEADVKASLQGIAKYCRTRKTTSLSTKSIIEASLAEVNARYFIVHADDLHAWDSFLVSFRRLDVKKGGYSPPEVAKHALLPQNSWSKRNIVPEGSESSLLENERDRLLFLERVFRPIVCGTHRRPIFTAVFDCDQKEANSKVKTFNLNERVKVLDANSYRDFLAYFCSVACILFPENNHDQPNGVSHYENIAMGARFGENWNLSSSFHAAFSPAHRDDNTHNSCKFCISCDTLSRLFKLECHYCVDEECQREYQTWQESESKSITVSKNVGSENTTNVILIEESIEVDAPSILHGTSFPLRVFDVHTNADTDSILASLSRCAGFPAIETQENDNASTVRRSSRKRKSNYPLGCIQDEDTIQANIGLNVAALRLLLLEKCTHGSQFELDHLVTLVLKIPNKDNGPSVFTDQREAIQFLDLRWSFIGETLQYVYEQACGSNICASPSEYIMLVRRAVGDDSIVLGKDELMEHLISLANFPTEKDSTTSASRKVRHEKGFTGTLLTSTVTTKSQANNGCVVDPISIEECDEYECAAPSSSFDQIIKQPSSFTGGLLDLRNTDKIYPLDNQLNQQVTKDTMRVATFVHNAEEKKEAPGPKFLSGGTSSHDINCGNHAISHKMYYKSVLEQYEDDDSDDSILDSPFERSSKRSHEQIKTTTSGEHPMQPRKRQTLDQGLKATIVSMLVANPDFDVKNEPMCEIAAEAVMQLHPDESDTGILTERAYSRYLDLIS